MNRMKLSTIVALLLVGCLMALPVSAGPLGQSLNRIALRTVAAQVERDASRRAPENRSEKRTHRKRNVLFGLALGAAAGSMATVLHCRGKSPSCNEIAPAYVLPSAGAGALIGVLWP